MKLSVCVQTYNHEPYVAQALDSVLMQKTDFDFEIIVGEDDSSDQTREICREYERAHSDRIRLFLNSRENVIYINGRATGRWNFMNNLRHARGDYVALLDGDDYWTDDCKLQKQVDYLDAHHECKLCGHRVALLSQTDHATNRLVPAGPSGAYSIEAIISGNKFPTCSMVFHRRVVMPLPSWFAYAPVADRFIQVMCGNAGEAVLLDDAMGAYRVHDQGIWSGLSQLAQIECAVEVLKLLRSKLRHCTEPTASRRIAAMYLKAAAIQKHSGRFDKALSAAFRAMTQGSTSYCLEAGRSSLRQSLRRQFPRAVGAYQQLRGRSMSWMGRRRMRRSVDSEGS